VKTVVLESLGCKLNQAELELLMEQFVAAGYGIGSDISEADVYLLNSCTVTHIADRKTRHLIRRAHRNNPDAVIIVTGCYAQRNPEELRAMSEVDCVVDNENKGQLLEKVTSMLDREKTREEKNDNKIPFNPLLRKGKIIASDGLLNDGHHFRTRSLLKIQEGCSHSCSFCIVPYVRGRSRSISEQQILNNIKNRVAAGYKEVTLTGTRIGDYDCQQSMESCQELVTIFPSGLSREHSCSRNDNTDEETESSSRRVKIQKERQRRSSAGNLVNLVQNILDATEIERLRLSSLSPQDITPEMVDLFRNSRLCRHIHVSLQSGSDTILRKMKRTYTAAEYAEVVHYAHKSIAGLAITTDVIIGFPGETAEEFEESYDFCCKMDFARMHVFPYSQRPGTPAAEITSQVNASIKQAHMRRMLELSQVLKKRFEAKFIGQKFPVLWEQQEKSGIWSGLTDNYIRMFVHSGKDLTNQLLLAELVSVTERGVLGRLC